MKKDIIDEVVHGFNEGEIPIFKDIRPFKNMTIHHFTVPFASIERIIPLVQLPLEMQEYATAELVKRTPNWLDLEEDAQMELIKASLTQETVLQYLINTGQVTEDAELYENSFDSEGTLHLDVFYIENAKTKEEILALKTKKRKQKKAKIVSFEEQKLKRKLKKAGK